MAICLFHVGVTVSGLDGGLGYLECFNSALAISEGPVNCDDTLVPS